MQGRSQLALQLPRDSSGDVSGMIPRFLWYLIGVGMLAIGPLIESPWRIIPFVVGMVLVAVDLSPRQSKLGIGLIGLVAAVWIVGICINPPGEPYTIGAAVIITGTVAITAALPQLFALRRASKAKAGQGNGEAAE